jgi:hypothetical protein
MSVSKRESAISAVMITISVVKITGAVTAVIAVAVAPIRERVSNESQGFN